MKTKYKCLYEITGCIEDVATFLVPISELPKEPEQEPVAWMNSDDISADTAFKWYATKQFATPLYTTPPQRNPLTDERILHFVNTHVGGPSPSYPLDNSDWINFARAIEAAHGIKE